MRIRKFNEAEESIILSTDRVEEIIQELSTITSSISEKKKMITAIVNELENYRSKSNTSNNQIDDAYLNLDSIDVKLVDSVDIIDNVIVLLKNYTEGGEKYLY
jgi:uncharacterized coiled-coil DUF342 family protein